MNTNAKKWFRDARFGAFIHWGLYALPGGCWQGESMDYIGEWVQSRFRIPHQEYARLAQEFHPDAFDAEEWVRKMSAAGMRYLVFTAKHHDGFAMYHSRVSSFNITDATAWGRDPLAELAQACRRHGMKLGVYYSHCLDWSDPDGADPGAQMPTNFGMSWGNDWDFPEREKKDFDRYFRRKALPQLEELLTNYGEIAVLWLDCPMGLNQSQAAEIVAMVRAKQPECLINSRIGFDYGDYGSLGDNQRPAAASDFPLETPATLNDTWGFKWHDQNWKSAEQVARELVSLASIGVNYLLNIGPRPDGAFPEATDGILHRLGEWMLEASEAIHGCGPSPFAQELPGLWCTAKANHLYLFAEDGGGNVVLDGLQTPVRQIRTPWQQRHGQLRFNTLLAHVDVELAGPPQIDPRRMPQNGMLQLTAPGAKMTVGSCEEKSGALRLGAAAEIFEDDAACHVNTNGFWCNWHHPQDALAWQVFFPHPGRYQVEIQTVNQAHSVPWAGDRQVIVRMAEQELSGELRPDQPGADPYYATANSILGVLTVAAAGEQAIQLETQSIGNPAAHSMAFAKLILKEIR